MNLALLFFCVILLIILLLAFSSVKINIEKYNFSNFEKGEKKKKIEKEIVAYLEIYIFGKIKIAKIRTDKKIFKKLKIGDKAKKIGSDRSLIGKIKDLDKLKIIKLKFDKVNLEAQIGTEDIMLTVLLVTIISTIAGIVLKNTDYKKTKFNVMPLYHVGNAINFKLNCIINVKLVHIIYVIYILLKKGMINNERTSNRRTYDYSYE